MRIPNLDRDISIVTTLYHSRRFLERFFEECLIALDRINCNSFEIVVVNDGSPDDSLEYVKNRQKDIPQIVLVDLSRNFGHHYAMQAGLDYSIGNFVFLIDCDLEVSPLTLIDFKNRLEETDSDVVYGYQESRKGGYFERISGGMFYKVFNKLSDFEIPENIATERVMTRRYVDALLKLGDSNLFLAGMMSWTGFKQLGMPLKKKQREGLSSYTILARINLMVNAVSSFSAQPLLWMFNIGLTITLLSVVFVIYLVLRKVLYDDALLGFTSMAALNALSLGVMTTGVGVIGIYLGKVFAQVKNRPNYIVKDVYRTKVKFKNEVKNDIK